MPLAKSLNAKRPGKPERLEARLSRWQKRLIARAARLRGTTVTDFVVASAQEAAEAAIREGRVLKLSPEASAVFVEAILNPPPPPTPAARAAARRYKAMIGR